MSAIGLLLVPLLASAGVPAKLSRVYTYRCTSTFFEGEGVSRGQITCLRNQQLGVITMDQTMYFHRSDKFTGHPAGDTPFSADICKRNSFLKTQCTGNTPSLAFGLSAEKTKEFREEVKVPVAPGKTMSVGFGAKPAADGNCPAGLQKMQAFRAKVGKLGLKLPNNVPLDGSADDVRLSWSQPADRLLLRQANATPCDGTGDCSSAVFAGQVASGPNPYLPVKGMAVCVVPATHFSAPESGGGTGAGSETSAQ